MNSHNRNAVGVLYLRVELHVVRGARQGGGLHRKAHRRGIAPFNFTFECPAKSLDARVVPGKFRTPAAGIDRISADKFLLPRVLQILPARHPRDRVVSDVVRKTWRSE